MDGTIMVTRFGLTIRRMSYHLALLMFFFCIVSGGLLHSTPAQAAGQRYVTIDFNDVDINIFIKYISELTKKNFIVDRNVKGNVTVISPTRISEQDAYRVFESVLEVHGYTTIPSGSVTKIVPSVQARSKNVEILFDERELTSDDRVVTQVIPLVHTDPAELRKILAPLVSKTSVLIAHSESGMLIITDVQSNISRLMEIIKAVDVPSIGEETVTIELEYADATTVAKSLRELFLKRAVKGAGNQTVKIIPYERTNSLIVFASGTEIDKIQSLLKELDRDIPRGEGKIRVYYLQHANAEELVKVLTSLPEKTQTVTKQAAARAVSQLSSDIKIMADAETNSLIIAAPREQYLVLEDVIRKLDIPRRMVYMEALIMEVSVTKEFELGIQWQDGNGSVITGFSGPGTSNNPFNTLKGLKAGTPSLPAGFTMGILKKGVEIGGVYFPNLGAVINAYKNDEDINIIATPQILTTDNKKASIKVGENVPYISRLDETGDGETLRDYTTYEYKDVATTLTLTPQINQADVVRMEIGVEVIKIKDLGNGNPTTFTRNADTTVIVHNEETVVLGGMIGQDTESGEYKVPFLGDIPLIGHLFKTSSNNETKTNLFIFITPHIVENPAQLAEIYYKKRDVVEEVQPEASEIADRFFYKQPNPAHSAALTDLGFAKLQNKEYKRAKEYFLQALSVDPDNPYAIINLGVVFEKEGNTAAARDMYQRVLDYEAGETVEEGRPSPYTALKRLAHDNMQNLKVSNP